MPTSAKLAICHYEEVLLDQFLVTRVDTEVGDRRLRRTTPGTSHSISSREQRLRCGLVERSSAEEAQGSTRQRCRPEHLRMMEGAMECLVEEQVASSSFDVVDESLRITTDEDNGDTLVDATTSSSSTSITAGSSSSPLIPPNCLNRMMTGSWTPSSATEVLQDIPEFSPFGWRILDSSGRHIRIISGIAVNALKADCDISDNAKKCKIHIDIAEKFFLWPMRRPQPG